jgi:hypothetical protein
MEGEENHGEKGEELRLGGGWAAGAAVGDGPGAEGRSGSCCWGDEQEREVPLDLLGPAGTEWTAPYVRDPRGRGGVGREGNGVKTFSDFSREIRPTPSAARCGSVCHRMTLKEPGDPEKQSVLNTSEKG